MKTIYFEAFFQFSKEYYISKLEKFENDKKVTFNLAAFLFGFFWFIYRKMYLQAFLIFIAMLVGVVLSQLLFIGVFNKNPSSLLAFQMCLNILTATFTGLYGNWIYINHAKKKITRTMMESTDENYIIEKLSRIGGTSYIVVTILVALVVLSLLNSA